MSDEGDVWTVLLAAGEGNRVRSYTCDANGEPIPKQFWALGGGDSLLCWAVRRASRLVPAKRIVVVVADYDGAS